MTCSVGKKPDALQGTLDLLVLKTLSLGPQHGYGIAAHVQRASDDMLRMEEGSLYPALHRMEQAGWISASMAGHGQQPPGACLPPHACRPETFE